MVHCTFDWTAKLTALVWLRHSSNQRVEGCNRSPGAHDPPGRVFACQRLCTGNAYAVKAGSRQLVPLGLAKGAASASGFRLDGDVTSDVRRGFCAIAALYHERLGFTCQPMGCVKLSLRLGSLRCLKLISVEPVAESHVPVKQIHSAMVSSHPLRF